MSDPKYAAMVLDAAEKSLRVHLALLCDVDTLPHNIELLLNLRDNCGFAKTPFRKLIDRDSALAVIDSTLERVRSELAQLEVA